MDVELLRASKLSGKSQERISHHWAIKLQAKQNANECKYEGAKLTWLYLHNDEV